VNKVSFSVTFGLLFLVIIAQVQEGYTQAIDPLTDSPGRTLGSDFNGDGIHDFIISAPQNDDGGNQAGAVYIFFGATNLSGTKSLGGVESADATIVGKGSDDRLGYGGVSGVGDVNADGIPDILVGAAQNDDGAPQAGAAYIFFGATNFGGTKTAGTDQNVEILGKANSDRLEKSVGGGRRSPGI